MLAAVAAPRLAGISGSFDEVRLHDQTLAALRYAQKTAVTMQRRVCVTFTGSTQLALTYSSAYNPPACDTNLMPPAGGGGGAAYTVVAQGGAGYTGQSDFFYDRVGSPSTVATMVIVISSGRQITIEPGSGYVH